MAYSDFTLEMVLEQFNLSIRETRSLIQSQSVIQAPVVVIESAKRGILENGLGQCAAAMVAAQLFNQTHNLAIPSVYGCVTSGSSWKFLKLSGTELVVDITEYDITPIERLLGILLATITTD